MTDKKESALIKFLRENMDIFAWCLAEMPGMPKELAEHQLKVIPGSKPVKQGL